MYYLGTGHCTNGYYAGWDNKGIDSLEACMQVCSSDARCKFAAYVNRRTCSRYGDADCTLNDDTVHKTYAKQPFRGKILFSIISESYAKYEARNSTHNVPSI